MKLKLLLVPVLGLMVGGCSLTGLGSAYKANSYFTTKDYDKGLATFSEKVRQHPNSAHDNYYLGRFYLAEQMPNEAIPHLRRAVSLWPGESDYQFWLGVASGVAGDLREERSRYEQALQHDPSHAKARLYLAHADLREGRYSQALTAYDNILLRYPYNAAALYNRALCLRFLDRQTDERLALQKYLKWYPAGYLAARAADRLNMMGDFSYRNHPFGLRTVTLKEVAFTPASAALTVGARDSLRLAGALLANLPPGKLQITVFHDGNGDLARRRALQLKAFLLEEYPPTGWRAYQAELVRRGGEVVRRRQDIAQQRVRTPVSDRLAINERPAEKVRQNNQKKEKT